MSTANTESTPEAGQPAETVVTPQSKRYGGFWATGVSFAIGAGLGVWAALCAPSVASSFLPLNAAEAVELDSLPARITLVVAVAAFVGFIGLMLDVVHVPESPGVSLVVRCLALTAGTTAFIGSWLSMPYALNQALTVYVIVFLSFVFVATLIVGLVLKSRISKED